MATIPQRELRNNIGDVLRRAEEGERITITVSGRPVAELGPVAGGRPFASGDDLARIFEATPVDVEWGTDLEHMREEERGLSSDPWAG